MPAGTVDTAPARLFCSMADRPQLRKLIKALVPGDVVITPAVDRLSRDTTDLLVIAREMQRAGTGIRSLAEPYLAKKAAFGGGIAPAPRLAPPNPADLLASALARTRARPHKLSLSV